MKKRSRKLNEAGLRRLVRNILREDFENFKSRTKDIDYESGLGASKKDKAKQLKRIFADEADHNFMKGLTKVHWVTGPNTLRGFLQGASSRDEISTNAYLPGQKVKGGSTSYLDNHQMLGVEVQGRVTLAASDMDLLYTGAHWNADPKVKKSSGVVRRAMEFEGSSPYFVKHYILDAPSFAEAHKIAPGKINEFVVDNWKPVAIRVGRPETYMNYDDPDRNLLNLDLVLDLAEKFNLPILGPSGEDLSEYFES